MGEGDTPVIIFITLIAHRTGDEAAGYSFLFYLRWSSGAGINEEE
jgi:tryptophan-rich sensory protein